MQLHRLRNASTAVLFIFIYSSIIFFSGCGYVSGVYGVRAEFQAGNKEGVAKYLTDKDPLAREEAVLSLAKMGDCSRLYNLTSDNNPAVRAALSRSLSSCNALEAMNALIILANDTSSMVRKAFAETAIQNSFCRDECYFALRGLLNDQDLFVKLAASKALHKRFPEEAHSAAIDCLSSQIHLVRTEAVEIIPLFRRQNDVYYLGELLQDSNPSMRVKARKAIEEILGHSLDGEEYARIIAKERLQPVNVAETGKRTAESLRNESVAKIKDEMPRLSDLGVSGTSRIDKNSIAVIIGNKDYSSIDIPNVDFALRDADIIKQAVRSIFGVAEQNIIYIENAKTSDFNKIFGTAQETKGLLANWVTPQSNIFVYYSGHGVPDSKSGEAYLVPVDSDINYIRLSGYPLKQLYKNLGELRGNSVTIVLDACFSGLSHAGTVTKAASPVYVEVSNPYTASDTNMVIFSSSKSDEISTWDINNRFGLFTYHFVKGLKEGDLNGDGLITVQEMEGYLTKAVPYNAKRLMNREQNPQVFGTKNTVLVRGR
jgi:hypothetical protein